MTDAGGEASIAAIILAAGAASRMGRLKQLLPFRGQTLIERTIEQAIDARFSPVIVVVGSRADEVVAAIGPPVEIVRNSAWESGMGSSIVAGMRHLQPYDPPAVAILLTDQPLVTSQHLLAMATLLRASPFNIVAAAYNGTVGVPALFRREAFDLLTTLPPESGAGPLLRRSSANVTVFPLPEAALDIDTPRDLDAVDRQYLI